MPHDNGKAQALAIAYSQKRKSKMASGGMVNSGDPTMNYAEGGSIGSHEGSDHEMDMVGRVMAKRQKHYSEGGKVANGSEDELSHMADSRPNNFDDLALRDDLDLEYTGDNSGDHLGNEREDEDRRDIVARVMRKRGSSA